MCCRHFPPSHDFVLNVREMIHRKFNMRLVEGNLQHRGAPSAGWKNPLSSPAVMLVASKLMALVWAFQQQGWAAFIPCLMVLAGQIAGLRWKKPVAMRKQALPARSTACSSIPVRADRADRADRTDRARRPAARLSPRPGGQWRPRHRPGLSVDWSREPGQAPSQTKSPAACNMRRGFFVSGRPA